MLPYTIAIIAMVFVAGTTAGIAFIMRDVVDSLFDSENSAKIFGVSSEEYYNYALRNREEWEDKGREVVTFMTERLRSKYRSRNNFRGRGSRMDAIAE